MRSPATCTDAFKGKVRVWDGTMVLSLKDSGREVSTTEIVMIERQARGKRHAPGKTDHIALTRDGAHSVARALANTLGYDLVEREEAPDA
jgi:hypothetical protein